METTQAIKLTALRTLTGSYGTVHEGEPFIVASEEDAESLESRGLAERYRPKAPAHDPTSFKMHYPAENKMQPAAANKTRNRA